MNEASRICLLDVVGLTKNVIGDETPVLRELSASGNLQPLEGVFPAVTQPPQATLLTGAHPSEHGIVGNGWLYRDTQEIRFWQQARQLIQKPTIYETAKETLGKDFTTALLFFWFSQGALDADVRVIPKPWYGSDGNKLFDVHGQPGAYISELKKELGEFPFFTFWGPNSGPPATEWIAEATAYTLRNKRPNLTLSYLPLLDYPLQKHSPDSKEVENARRNIDKCVDTVYQAARDTGTKLVLFSEYGLMPVNTPVHINRILREQNWLRTRSGPFGERLDIHQSRVFAAADHQIAHVYVRDRELLPPVKETLSDTEGIDVVLGTEGKREYHVHHPRAGELVAVAEPDAWFTYYFWQENDRPPDYARTVDIHRKPGYDPVEMFVDPDIHFPRLKAGWTLLKKKLGFRYRMNLIPLDATLISGSHGRLPEEDDDKPVLISPDLPLPADRSMTAIHDWLLTHLGGPGE